MLYKGFETDIEDFYGMAASLYDGGWRTEDREEMMEEYDLTGDEADELCEYFERFEQENETE